ncbi:MAG TPA: primosomal protein N', partial [Bryobacteraceae bacterium]|nr:primosomal protein N' [Bryobacteraceae bacterium]
MEAAPPRFADVSLPVPLDRPFTYELPETLRHRVRAGCRLIVPFGGRKLTGMVLRTHDDPPEAAARSALLLLDEEPALEPGMLELARWVAQYYCAPLGEVLRVMTPLAGEVRKSKVYSLTDAGVDAARQLLIGTADDPATRVLQLLESRPRTAPYLAQKVANAARILQTLAKKGLVHVEDVHAERDPMRASAARLRIEYTGCPQDVRLSKAERELLSYLDLHPGSHNLGEIEASVPKASETARSLARRGLLALVLEAPVPLTIA